MNDRARDVGMSNGAGDGGWVADPTATSGGNEIGCRSPDLVL
jgi:hypothetical protein